MELAGPAGASDNVTLGILLPNGRHTRIGPDFFRFDESGHATVVFLIHAMPLDAAGTVSAQVLFSGEEMGTPVCGMEIVPGGSPTIH